MGRAPCCDKKGLKRGPWTSEEDEKLVSFINKNGHGSWRSLPKLAGLLRCGKSCRLRWANYLRPDIKRGPFSPDEEKLVFQLHAILGNRWAAIASQLPGRTDNEIKNLWNTHLKKQLPHSGLDPKPNEPPPRRPRSAARHMAQSESAPRLKPLGLGLGLGLDSSSDFFLRLWNSEVGETFRDLSKSSKSFGSPCTMASFISSGGARDGSGLDDNVWPTSDSWSLHEADDTSESELRELLLDFPGENDMSFLGQPDYYCHGSSFS